VIIYIDNYTAMNIQLYRRYTLFSSTYTTTSYLVHREIL